MVGNGEAGEQRIVCETWWEIWFRNGRMKFIVVGVTVSQMFRPGVEILSTSGVLPKDLGEADVVV